MGTTFERDDSDERVIAGQLRRAADAARFEEFYRQYQPRLTRYAVSRNAVDPEGVAHLALLDGFGALDRMRSRDPRSVRAYLFRAVSSHTAMEHRRRNGEQLRSSEGAAEGDGFEDMVVGRMEFDRALDLLPRDQQVVMRLRFAEDLSAEEVGQVVGKTANAVRQLQLRGIRRLRRLGFTAAVLLILAGAVVLVWRWTSPQVSLEPAESRNLENQGEPVEVVDVQPDSDTDTGNTEVSSPQSVDADSVGSASLFDLPQDEPPAGQDQTGDSQLSPDSTEITGAELTSEPAVELPAEQPVEIPIEPPADLPIELPAAPPVRAQAYEGFDLTIIGADVADNPSVSSHGFANSTTWSITQGAGTAVHDPIGLRYVDVDGRSLATSPGAVRFAATASGTHLARPLASPAEPSYWAAYLLRQDSTGYGDAFWSPDGVFDRGAVGIQQYGRLRYVNGATTDIAFEVGQTYLLVVRVEGEQSSLWINPTLNDPGTPDAVYSHEQSATPERLILVTNELNDGAYTFDEVRLGTSFEAVAPTG
jgi:RNA polymerase sigma-70 factor (ECF subfamily)